MAKENTTKLQAIFFDIDDTIYSTSEFSEMARMNSIDAMIAAGLRMQREELKRELAEVIHEFSSNYEHHFSKLLLRIPAKYYQGINPAVLEAAAVIAYHDTKFRHLSPYEDVMEALKLLAKTDIIRGIISAGREIKQAEKLVRLKVINLITPNAVFISDQIGISKPNKKLYLRACSDLNISPSNAMYIGDNPINDIDPPNSIGMITVWNHRSGKHLDVKGETEPDHEIHNFYDLIELLEEEYGVKLR